VKWIDCTVTGMGRGPGNVQTEYVAIEVENIEQRGLNITPLLRLIKKYFKPMQEKCGWGMNPYYYMAGQLGIHPTYIQEMLGDKRFEEEDLLALLTYLKGDKGNKFVLKNLQDGRQKYLGKSLGTWSPESLLKNREVLIIGSGPGVLKYKKAIEQFIEASKPFVVALNANNSINEDLIDIRVACHPLRLYADSRIYSSSLSKPIVVPYGRLDQHVKDAVRNLEYYNFGLEVKDGIFKFDETSAIVPNTLVVAYALAIATSGRASKIFLVGFDGYGVEDPRTDEANSIFLSYQKNKESLPIVALTPTCYAVPTSSIYVYN